MKKKKYKRCVIPAIAELVFKTNNCTWPVGPSETHICVYILYTIKKILIIEHWRVCLHLSLRARVGYFQQWQNVNLSFSANSKSFSIFNSKGSRLWGLVTKKKKNTQLVQRNKRLINSNRNCVRKYTNIDF